MKMHTVSYVSHALSRFDSILRDCASPVNKLCFALLIKWKEEEEGDETTNLVPFIAAFVPSLLVLTGSAPEFNLKRTGK